MHPVDDSSDATAQRRPKRFSMLLVGTKALREHLGGRPPRTPIRLEELRQVDDDGGVYFADGEVYRTSGSGSNDYGAQLLLARYSDHSCIHLAVEAVHLGQSEIFGLDEQTRYTALLAYEHQLTPTSSVVLQVQGTESPFEDLGIRDLGDRAYLFDIGIKKGFSRSTVVFLALSENVVNFGNSADVGLHLGLTWTH